MGASGAGGGSSLKYVERLLLFQMRPLGGAYFLVSCFVGGTGARLSRDMEKGQKKGRAFLAETRSMDHSTVS